MNTTKIQIISDLHLGKERKTIEIKPCAEYLLIGGDVDEYVNGFKLLKKFLNYVTPMFKKVIWIMGNHEVMASSYSLKSLEDIIKACEKLAIKTGTIFLHNNSCDLTDELIVIGSPLFSHIPDGFVERVGKNPFPRGMKVKIGERIFPKKVDTELFNKLHEEAKSAIIKELEECSRKGKRAIIMTHYGPLAPSATKLERDSMFRQNEKEYSHYNTDDDMMEVLQKCKHLVLLWTFGHCHSNRKFRFDSETRIGNNSAWGFDVVSNQLGHFNKPFKGSVFNPEYIYTVEHKFLEGRNPNQEVCEDEEIGNENEK